MTPTHCPFCQEILTDLGCTPLWLQCQSCLHQFQFMIFPHEGPFYSYFLNGYRIKFWKKRQPNLTLESSPDGICWYMLYNGPINFDFSNFNIHAISQQLKLIITFS